MTKMSLEELVAQFSKRKRPSSEEHRIQKTCVRWFSLKYPQFKGRLFAVPNGGKRDAATAQKLKEEGVMPGVSDLILLIPNKFYGALLIEMKKPKAKQSPQQIAWEKIITERGEYKYTVCTSWEEFVKEIETYLKDY